VPDPEQASAHPAERESMEGDTGVDHATFVRVLEDSVAVAERSGVPYAVMGGIASSALGRDRWTHDVDVFVRRQDAGRLLRRYAEAGFEVEQRDEAWLYKAWRDQVMVDLIFEVNSHSTDPIDFDEEMRARVREVTFEGVRIPALSPEDLVVIKAVVHKEHRARHWFDALGLIGAGGLDWEYLLRRARQRSPRRVLSLLLYAQSDGLEVPDRVVRALWACLRPPAAMTTWWPRSRSSSRATSAPPSWRSTCAWRTAPSCWPARSPRPSGRRRSRRSSPTSCRAARSRT
jgi:predicted nucleotidyltransferase